MPKFTKQYQSQSSYAMLLQLLFNNGFISLAKSTSNISQEILNTIGNYSKLVQLPNLE
jgi:hypothetical protein